MRNMVTGFGIWFASGQRRHALILSSLPLERLLFTICDGWIWNLLSAGRCYMVSANWRVRTCVFGIGGPTNLALLAALNKNQLCKLNSLQALGRPSVCID